MVLHQLVANTFPKESLSCMIIIALLCTAVPFIFLGYYHIKTNAKISSFFIGMGFYALFYFGAEGVVNTILFRFCNLGVVLDRSIHPVWYAIYGAVIAGIFEELGKYIGLRFAMKKREGKQNAFLYGVGHGGFEAIAFGSSLFMGNIVLAFMVNSLGMDAYLAKLSLSGNELAEYKSAIQQLIAVTLGEHLCQGLERVLAMVLQVSLTILVYTALKNKKSKYWFPLATIIHSIAYLPIYLAQVQILSPIQNLMILSGITVLTCAIASRVYYGTLTTAEEH